MRRLIALVAALAAALLVLTAPPASAGGPTSVLIVNYEGSRAAGALTGSAAYDNLSRALDAMNPPQGEATSPGAFMDAQIRLTWMIHDVTPWRIDALALDGDEVWVTTTMSPNGGGTAEPTATRHRPKDAALLIDTLASLGVIDSATPGALQGSAGAATPGASEPGQVAAEPTQSAVAGELTQPAAGPAATEVPLSALLVATTLALVLGAAGGRLAGRRRGAEDTDGRHGAEPIDETAVGFTPDRPAQSR